MGAARTEPDNGKRGKGELLRDPLHIRADLNLIEKGIREGYPIGPEKRADWLQEAHHIATAKKEDGSYLYRARVRISALRVVERFDRSNLERVRILASLTGKDEGGYQPSELHKHEHIHLESSAEAPAPVQIEVTLVSDWYGEPDVLPAPSNGKKAKRNGKATKAMKNGKPNREKK